MDRAKSAVEPVHSSPQPLASWDYMNMHVTGLHDGHASSQAYGISRRIWPLAVTAVPSKCGSPWQAVHRSQLTDRGRMWLQSPDRSPSLPRCSQGIPHGRHESVTMSPTR